MVAIAAVIVIAITSKKQGVPTVRPGLFYCFFCNKNENRKRALESMREKKREKERLCISKLIFSKKCLTNEKNSIIIV